jgi:hypothetical protein
MNIQPTYPNTPPIPHIKPPIVVINVSRCLNCLKALRTYTYTYTQTDTYTHTYTQTDTYTHDQDQDHDHDSAYCLVVIIISSLGLNSLSLPRL